MAFNLPATFDEQLVLDAIEYTVERLFWEVMRVVEMSFLAFNRILEGLTFLMS